MSLFEITVFGLNVLLIAIITAATCAIPGSFIVLQRSSMLVDALSHAVLPGIVVGFLLTHDLRDPLLLVGAGVSSLLVVIGSTALQRTGLIAGDAPIGLMFMALFSIGVLLVTKHATHVHLDVHAVLVGDLSLVAMEKIELAGVDIGPRFFYIMLALGLINLLLVAVFYRQLQVSTFDPEFARTLGLRTELLRWSLLILTAVTVTAAFYVVGAVLVIALFIIPAALAMLHVKHLRTMIFAAAIWGASAAAIGFFISYKVANLPTGPTVAAVLAVMLLAVIAAQRLLAKFRKKS
ncbi:MAG: metal ABC transporter permease [Microbacteriaceae bacterium]|nr:metal ABC transporter permease [Microbacteriaceae bacterium]